MFIEQVRIEVKQAAGMLVGCGKKWTHRVVVWWSGKVFYPLYVFSSSQLGLLEPPGSRWDSAEVPGRSGETRAMTGLDGGQKQHYMRSLKI